jgi:hypothetical protein
MKLLLMTHIIFFFYFGILNQAIPQDFDRFTSAKEFDCVNQNPCQILIRRDSEKFVDLKYYHKRKIIYHFSGGGYFYYAYNPARDKELAFDLKVSVNFNKIILENKIIEVSIEPETQSGQVYMTSSGSEKLSWRYLFSETPTLSPTLLGDRILICTDNRVEGGKLHSLNSKTGKLDWFFLTPGAILSQPIQYENSIIVIDDSGNIYWIDKNSGTMRYKFKMQEFPVHYPIVKDKVLYLAGRRGHLYALKLDSAQLVWQDLALAGEVKGLSALKKGFVIQSSNQYSLFSYTTGSKQDIMQGNQFND